MVQTCHLKWFTHMDDDNQTRACQTFSLYSWHAQYPRHICTQWSSLQQHIHVVVCLLCSKSVYAQLQARYQPVIHDHTSLLFMIIPACYSWSCQPVIHDHTSLLFIACIHGTRLWSSLKHSIQGLAWDRDPNCQSLWHEIGFYRYFTPIKYS